MLGLALTASVRMNEAGDSKRAGKSLEHPNIPVRDEIPGHRLLEELGEGGCGVVYMAEQQRPVHRKVAVKVIKLGMDTRQVVARFEAERQALARMDHPNIAKVLDAGATKSGRPYFTMELVGGRKITDYCDEKELTTRERLELFVQVCRAVQHAHQKGIIHRDIKPSNVLVAHHDGKPVPKIIDFGIAKATQGKLIDQTLFTAFEQFMGTPVYMSPEQAELGGLDVDTRSDIYSLGVLLYELLTGKTPFQVDSSRAAGVEAIRRTVVEKEPIKPSTRLRAMRQEQLTSVARARQIDPPKLLKLIRGDLDWIVMKCLEKDRSRRYETANDLAMDVQRHLNDEPVLARPPSTAYQVRKFIRRNKLATLSVTAISLSLLLGIAASAWQAIKATRAERQQSRLRQEAQAARQDATEKLWASYAAEARARRLSREAGASFESLAAIQKAAAIRPSLALRNEAIAALAQADIRLVKTKPIGNKPGFAMDLTAPRYAVCDESGKVSIHRESDDTEVATLPPTNFPAVTLWSFSQDGVLLSVLYADHHLRVWDWERSHCILDVANPSTGEFSPDGKRLAVKFADRIAFFDLSSANASPARETGNFDPGAGDWFFHFHPGGNLLAVYSEDQSNIFIVNVKSAKAVTTVQHNGPVFRLAWSPDGKYFATPCKDVHNVVHIWDAESGTEFKSFPTRQTICAVFNPEGNLLVTSGWDGRTRLLDFPNCRELVNIYHSGSIIGFRPDSSTLIQADWDGPNIAFLQLANPRGLRTLRVHESIPKGPSGFAAFSRDGKLLAFNTVDGLTLWDVAADAEIGLYHGEAAVVGFDSEDRHLIGIDSEGLLLWSLTSLRDPSPDEGRAVSTKSRAGLPEPVRPDETVIGGTAGLSPDGEYCFLSGNNRCQILNTRTFNDPVFTGIHPGARFSAANRDASLIASGAWHSPGVKVWDGRSGKLVKSFDTPNTTSVAFSPDGLYLVMATEEKYTFCRVDSWSQVLSIPQQQGNEFVPMMAFSPDGRIFAGTHSRNIIRLHDAATGEVLADLEPPDPHEVTGLCFNNDGTRLAVCEGYQAARIWDLQVIRSHLATMGLDWQIPPKSR